MERAGRRAKRQEGIAGRKGRNGGTIGQTDDSERAKWRVSWVEWLTGGPDRKGGRGTIARVSGFGARIETTRFRGVSI